MFHSEDKPQHYDKGQFLFRQGEALEELFIIHKGLVKAYYTTFEGKELVKSFIAQNGYISSLNALIANKPASFSVVCIEPCEVSSINKAAINQLQQHQPEKLNIILMQLAQKKEQREYELLCLSAEQRYQKFIEEQKELSKRLSQIDIASYLGITPVALSRIKKRLLQQ